MSRTSDTLHILKECIEHAYACINGLGANIKDFEAFVNEFEKNEIRQLDLLKLERKLRLTEEQLAKEYQLRMAYEKDKEERQRKSKRKAKGARGGNGVTRRSSANLP